jgi:hypothetical protein
MGDESGGGFALLTLKLEERLQLSRKWGVDEETVQSCYFLGTSGTGHRGQLGIREAGIPGELVVQ